MCLNIHTAPIYIFMFDLMLQIYFFFAHNKQFVFSLNQIQYNIKLMLAKYPQNQLKCTCFPNDEKCSVNSAREDHFHQQIQKKNERKNIKEKGIWKEEQKVLYFKFVVKNQEWLKRQNQRRNSKVFQKMSQAIQTRNSKQCKSHHQKVMKRFSNLSNILEFGRKTYPNLGKQLINGDSFELTLQQKQQKLICPLNQQMEKTDHVSSTLMYLEYYQMLESSLYYLMGDSKDDKIKLTSSQSTCFLEQVKQNENGIENQLFDQLIKQEQFQCRN